MIIFGRNIDNIEIEPSDSSTYSYELMSHHYVQLDFNLDEEILIPKGSYIQYEGFTFKVYDNVTSTQGDTGYNYSVLFKDPNYAELDRFITIDRSQGRDISTFMVTSNLATHAQFIADNLNYYLDTTAWSISVDPALNITLKDVSYDGGYLVDELNNIATIFDCEWWIANNIIHLGKLGIGTDVDFKEGEIVSSITTESGNVSDSGNRIIAFGGTRNLTSSYGQASGASNSLSEIRLCLPENTKYIDAWPDMEIEDVVHKRLIFDDIYPKNTDTITSIEEVERNIEDEDGEVTGTFTAYIVTAEDSSVTEDDVIEKANVTIYFTSGQLQGYRFSIYETSDLDLHQYEIIAIHDYDNDTMPGVNAKPMIGDTFVVEGVELPEERALVAELELKAEVEAWIVKHGNTDTHSVTVDAVYCSDNNFDFQLGQRVKLYSNSLRGGERSSRIIGFDKPLYCKYAAVYSIGDDTSYSSRLAALESGLEETQYTQRFGVSSSNGFYIITTYDNTVPTDLNVFSASHVLSKYARYGKNANFAAALITEGLTVRDNANGPNIIESIGDVVNINKATAIDGGLLVKKNDENYLETTNDALVIGKTLNANDGILVKLSNDKYLEAVNDSVIISKALNVNAGLFVNVSGEKYLETVNDTVTVHKTLELNDGLLVNKGNEKYLEILPDYIALDKSFGSRGASGGILGSGLLYNKDTGLFSVDKIEVRKYAIFNELRIQKITSLGGQNITSHGNAIISKVTEGGTYYRCEIETNDGEVDINYTVGSLVRMQEFNAGARYFWRAVTSIGTDYFNLSKANCDDGSCAPQAGDHTVGLGHLSDESRQSAIIQSAVGDANPYIRFYGGIDSFSLYENTKGERCLLGGTGDNSDVTDPVLGKLTKNSLYHTDAYLRGKFILASTNETIEQTFAIADNKLVSEISSAKIYTDTAVANVGGVNLITGTKDASCNTSTEFITDEIYNDFVVCKGDIVASGLNKLSAYIVKDIATGTAETVTLSFYAKSSINNTVFTNYWYSPHTTLTGLSSQGNTSTANNGNISGTLSTEWKRYWFTWTQTESDPKDLIIGKISAGDISICGVKMEKGNVATDWSQSEKDITIYTESKFTQLADSISLSVSRDNIISQINSEINLSPDTIKIKGERIDIVGAVTFSSFDNSLQTVINDKATTNDVSTVNDKIDNLEIGGVNLFNDTALLKGTTSSNSDWFSLPQIYSDGTFNYVKEAYDWGIRYDLDLNIGFYTLSYYTKTDGDTDVVKSRIKYNNLEDGGANEYDLFVNVSNEWTRHNVTFEVTSNNVFKFYFLSDTEDVNVCFAHMQLERGKVLSDWSQSSEDAQNYSDKSIISLGNSITNDITEVNANLTNDITDAKTEIKTEYTSAIVNNTSTWTNIYKVSSVEKLPLTYYDGTALPLITVGTVTTPASYSVTLFTKNTSAITRTTGQLDNINGVWKWLEISKLGNTGNHPNIFIVDNVPYVITYHKTKTYDVSVKVKCNNSDGVTDLLPVLLGYTYDEMKTNAIAGKTLITGGLVNTEMLDVDNLIARKIRTAVTGERLEVNCDGLNSLKVYDEYENLRTQIVNKSTLTEDYLLTDSVPIIIPNAGFMDDKATRETAALTSDGTYNTYRTNKVFSLGTIPKIEGVRYDLTLPIPVLSVRSGSKFYYTDDNENGMSDSRTEATLFLHNKTTGNIETLGTVTSENEGDTVSLGNFQIEFTEVEGGEYEYVLITEIIEDLNQDHDESTAWSSFSLFNDPFVATKILRQNIIGNDLQMWAYSGVDYSYNAASTNVIRKGFYGQKITSEGHFIMQGGGWRKVDFSSLFED